MPLKRLRAQIGIVPGVVAVPAVVGSAPSSVDSAHTDDAVRVIGVGKLVRSVRPPVAPLTASADGSEDENSMSAAAATRVADATDA